jgi:hypothetical protein
MPKVNLDTDLLFEKRWRKKPKYGRVAVILMLFVVTLIVAGHDFSYKEQVYDKDSCATAACHRHVALSRYFERKGSPDPQRMATAVLETSRPRLMASIAVRESGGDPKAIGDGGKSRGAFQVQAKHHGKVSKDPIEQARQSERILEELLAENNGNLKKSLSAYNGEISKKVYANKILAELERVP